MARLLTHTYRVLLPKSPKHGVDQRGEYLSGDKARFQTEVPAGMNTRSYSSINLYMCKGRHISLAALDASSFASACMVHCADVIFAYLLCKKIHDFT